MQNTSASARLASLVSRFGRAVVVASALVAAVSAQAGIKSEKLLSAILENTPKPTIVTQGAQFREAEKAAATIPGAEAFWGMGSSMEPLYASNTAIIVAPMKFTELKKGMTVVYMSSRGRMVAHSLKSDLPKGWIVQGLNNDEEDDDLVTKKNIVGVIVKAYSATEAGFHAEFAKRVASKDHATAVASRT